MRLGQGISRPLDSRLLPEEGLLLHHTFEEENHTLEGLLVELAMTRYHLIY